MPLNVITEVVQLKPSKAFFDNPSLFETLREAVHEGGINHQSWALTIEEPKKLYWLVHHEYGFKIEDFKWNKEKYGDMREKLLEIAEEYPAAGWLHLEGDVFPDGVTTAPITDVAIIQMKEGFDEAKWAEVINFAMDDVRTAKGFHNGCWAVSKGQTYVVAGWDSVEDHEAYMKSETSQKVNEKVIPFVTAGGGTIHGKFVDIVHDKA